MSGNYRYRKLASIRPGVPKEFRLLTILRGAGTGDDLRCRITHHALPAEASNAPSPVEYEALSWTWGEEVGLQPLIILDDKQREFALRPNLYQALRNLRLPDKDRNLWVDYICINQSDKAEKDLQVKLMFSIYSKASNVCIWLGEHFHNSQIAVKFIKERINDLGNFEQLTDDESTAEEWKALAALMDRKWFSRRWVVQELALAKKATVHCAEECIDWTDFETAVSLFDRDAERLAGFYKGSKASGFDHQFFGDVGQMGATRLVQLRSNLFRFNENGEITEYRFTLTDLVSNLSSFEAKEPHDVIYAILSLARDTHSRVDVSPGPVVPLPPMNVDLPALPPTPPHSEDEQTPLEASLTDEQKAKLRKVNVISKFRNSIRPENSTIFTVKYEQHFFMVCKQFLQFTIPKSEFHNLDILLRPWAPKTKERLPSWIPSVANAAFGRKRAPHAPAGYQTTRSNADPLVGQITHGTRSSYYNAGRLRKAEHDEWGFLDDGMGMDPRLFVTGFVLDRIGEIEDASQFGNVSSDWLLLGGWDEVDGPNSGVPDAFWRTLVADRGPEGSNTKGYYRKAAEHAAYHSIEGIQTTALKQPGHPVLVEFLKRVEAVVWNRRLFKSTRGRSLGLAPKGAQSGDYICIIRGMSVPVGLRRKVDKAGDEYYSVIGEVYLHTMMDGLAIDYQEQRLEELKSRTDSEAVEERELLKPHRFVLH